jgi:hypothetical protein
MLMPFLFDFVLPWLTVTGVLEVPEPDPTKVAPSHKKLPLVGGGGGSGGGGGGVAGTAAGAAGKAGVEVETVRK